MGKKQKRKKHQGYHESQLVDIPFIFPISIGDEMCAKVLEDIQKMALRTEIIRSDQYIKIIAKANPRQSIELDNFARSLGVKYYGDGIDSATLKSYLAEKGYVSEYYELPRDRKVFSIRVAAAGAHCAFLDYPTFRSSEEILKLCKDAEQINNEVQHISTNDIVLYRQIYRQAYNVGYILAMQQMNAMDRHQRERFHEKVVATQADGYGLESFAAFCKFIERDMARRNVEDVVDLLL